MPPANDLESASLALAVGLCLISLFLGLRQWYERRAREPDLSHADQVYFSRQDVRQKLRCCRPFRHCRCWCWWVPASSRGFRAGRISLPPALDRRACADRRLAHAGTGRLGSNPRLRSSTPRGTPSRIDRGHTPRGRGPSPRGHSGELRPRPSGSGRACRLHGNVTGSPSEDVSHGCLASQCLRHNPVHPAYPRKP